VAGLSGGRGKRNFGPSKCLWRGPEVDLSGKKISPKSETGIYGPGSPVLSSTELLLRAKQSLMGENHCMSG